MYIKKFTEIFYYHKKKKTAHIFFKKIIQIEFYMESSLALTKMNNSLLYDIITIWGMRNKRINWEKSGNCNFLLPFSFSSTLYYHRQKKGILI